MDGWMYACMHAWMDGWMDACMHACMDGWMDGWMDRVDGQMGRWIDGKTARQKEKNYKCMHKFENKYRNKQIRLSK